MTNGAYLVYSQLCTKQNPRIHDIFIARGSDGKWYYSTFHFCIEMFTLRAEVLGRASMGRSSSLRTRVPYMNSTADRMSA